MLGSPIATRCLLPAALVLLMGLPGLALAQSDATCVAYMKADDAFQQALEQAPEYPEFLEVKKLADEAQRQAKEAEKLANEAVQKFRHDHSKESNRAKDESLMTLETATGVAIEVLELLTAARNKLLATLEPANDRRTKAHMAAYKGPVSDNPRVMAKLVFADVERCRRRFE